jgi:hypothetical protein
MNHLSIKKTAGLVVVLLIGLGQALVVVSTALAESGSSGRQYVPMVSGGQALSNSCQIPNTRYETLSISGPSLNVNPEKNIDLNLAYRGYKQTTAPLNLVSYGPVDDRLAPQFPAMFADNRLPGFVNTYQRYRWDDDCNCPVDTYSPWPATVLGLRTQANEVIHTPDSGYDIGGGREFMVLYAGDTGITLHIGREDDLNGYVVHIEGLCVEPDLLALYRRTHAAGRDELPSLRARQPIGRALGDEIRVAVRDNGHFLDPRSRNDWWQGR